MTEYRCKFCHKRLFDYGKVRRDEVYFRPTNNMIATGNLLKKIDAGCTDHLQLCQLSGAGMGCGSCRPEVKSILDYSLKLKHHETVIG